jgi:23S rRNA G2445 N2-methylase RlmL
MQYRYALDRNFEDYASGRVFYARKGQPAFPVRLASEIFQRAYKHWQAGGGQGRCRIYDPVCGGGYWLVVLAYLHWEAISAIYASDFDGNVLHQAERNISLITPEGLNQRISEIEAMVAKFHKESHQSALVSARQFYRQLEVKLQTHAVEGMCFQTDATDAQNMSRGLAERQVDLILADVPYGWHSQWQIKDGDVRSQFSAQDASQTPIEAMLSALHSILEPGAVLAIAYDKSQKIQHDKFLRLERFQVGKRRILILLKNQYA